MVGKLYCIAADDLPDEILTTLRLSPGLPRGAVIDMHDRDDPDRVPCWRFRRRGDTGLWWFEFLS